MEKTDSLSKQLLTLELIRREHLKNEHPVWNELVFNNVINILRDATVLGVHPARINNYIIDILDELCERRRAENDQIH